MMTRPDSSPTLKHLSDYTPSPFTVRSVHLRFELDPSRTVVTSTLHIERAPHSAGDEPLELDGDALTFVSATLDGAEIPSERLEVSPSGLRLASPPARFTLCVTTALSPSTNKELMGLYASSGNFCTQCEAQGFRRITYYLDRPDVLSVFTTELVADAARYPTLLSNGNPVSSGALEGGRHVAVWHDPFPKPCYLFALVAGRFDLLEGDFTTASGRRVTLRVYTDEGQGAQCHHALEAIKKSMRWDEVRYGREYDLDLFMVVAVNDFNFGAMENKGLNIFNAKYILASAETATDDDFAGVETVVAHEYFHNWSGNRVTLRDWFQLSLKEGLTVYRDQAFDEDNISRVVHRVNTVNRLRAGQFKEDQGPMAHPVRPRSYLKIDNFYTATVYNKGAEVIRMFHLLLGDEAYRAACDEYFSRFDGQAATIEDFAGVMQAHTPLDLTPFLRWYDQAGTPRVEVSGAYDAAARAYTLTARQSTPATPGQPHKLPVLIPVKLGLLDAEGRAVPTPELHQGELWLLTEAEQSITLRGEGGAGLPGPVVPSLLRHFSAPVKLDVNYSDDDLDLLARHDPDGFNRWQAAQLLALGALRPLISAAREGARDEALRALVSPRYVSAFGAALTERLDDRFYHAQLLSLPSEAYLAELEAVVDPVAIERARGALRATLAAAHAPALRALYDSLSEGSNDYTVAQMGRRALRGACLAYLCALPEGVALARAQFNASLGVNMTDCVAALSCLVHTETPEREEALARFEERWRGQPLIMNKWLMAQAQAKVPNALERVRGLMGHPAFSVETPNCVYALIGGFTNGNPARFHAAGGEGYRFLSEVVLRLDAMNPMVAARMVDPLTHWRRVDPARGGLMRAELEAIRARGGLSANLLECVEKSLA
jgi:aminopeptidase N